MDIERLSPDTLPLDQLRKPQGHKYDHGHALVLTGGPGKTGAARLAARGALRIGAGAVTLGAPANAYLEVAVQITALMLRRLDDAAALETALKDTRFNAICLGPGFGLKEREQELLLAALAAGRRCVLDADALTLLARDGDAFRALHPSCVLTPHGGEFARLFPDIAVRLERGQALTKPDATQAAAQKAGCTVIFKGAQTCIATPEGQVAHHLAEGAAVAPWLATAGSGDVLAGFVTGLLARGGDIAMACKSAVVLHAACAKGFGPGLIAEDLPEGLPKVFRQLGL